MSNGFYHSSLPRHYALLGGFSWDAQQLRRFGPFDDFHAFKMGPLDDPLELGEKKKVTQSKIRGIGRLFPYDGDYFGQELLDALHALPCYFSDTLKPSVLIF